VRRRVTICPWRRGPGRTPSRSTAQTAAELGFESLYANASTRSAIAIFAVEFSAPPASDPGATSAAWLRVILLQRGVAAFVGSTDRWRTGSSLMPQKKTRCAGAGARQDRRVFAISRAC